MIILVMRLKALLKIIGALVPIYLLVNAAAAGQSYEESMARGDSLYSLYDYNGSIEAYRTAAGQDTLDSEAFRKLARSLNLKGELVPKDSELVVFEEARDAAERAIELNPDNADSHFQLARALGKIALHKGIFKSASLAKQVRAECRRALELDSLHDGAWHILGRWNREVSKKPKILRIPMGLGDANKKDALKFMKKAVEIAPTNLDHRLEMGNTYRRYKMYDLAKEEYRKCLDLPFHGPVDEKYRAEAKKNLEELDEN